MNAATALKEISILRELASQFVDKADEVLARLNRPDSSLSGNSKSSGLSENQRTKLLSKRRKNVVASLTRQQKQKSK